jgi:zinc protease
MFRLKNIILFIVPFLLFLILNIHTDPIGSSNKSTSDLSTLTILNQNNKHISKPKITPHIDIGELDNGLTYYLAENNTPESKVYIRLLIKAGTINEEDSQQGVAHFLEHMAFNGTKNYPLHTLFTALENIGITSSIDVNAATYYENTIYTLNLPNNDKETLDLALNIISDWVSHITISNDELNNERGIILEEWRAYLGPITRLHNKKMAIEMAGSQYVMRSILGEPNSIETISRQQLIDFYKKWYRPDNISIIVAGDINTTEIKKLIGQKLGNIPRPKKALESINYSIPIKDEWRSATVSEKGISFPTVELSFFSNYRPESSDDRYKENLTKKIVVLLLNQRLQHLKDTEESSINFANFHVTPAGKETVQSIFTLQLFKSDYDKATKELMTFLAQLKQQGFNSEEVNNEITQLKNLNEITKKNRTDSLELIDKLLFSAENNELYRNKKDTYELEKRFLNEITLTDINNVFLSFIEAQSKLLLTTQPVTQKKKSMSAERLTSLWKETVTTSQPLWLKKEKFTNLPELTIKKGTISKEKEWKNYNITEYRLSNGSKLIYQYNDIEANKIYFRALTKGGLRSISKDKYNQLRVATILVDDTGIGEVSQADLQNIFQGKPVAMSTILADYQQGYSGWADKDNLANMFTLFHLKLTSSPISKQLLHQNKIEASQYKNTIDGYHKFISNVYSLRYPNIDTVYSEKNLEIADFTATMLSNTYQKYITNKTDYTYFIVGDISSKEVEEFAATYLASIKVKTQTREPYFMRAVSPKERYTGFFSNEQRAEVELYLTQSLKWASINDYYLRLSSEVIEEQLHLTLREKASGTYSVTSEFWQNINSTQAEGQIKFMCAPGRVDELLKLTKLVLKEMGDKGVDERILHNKLQQHSEQFDQYLRSNIGVLNAMEHSYLETDTPDLMFTNLEANSTATKEKVDSILRNFLTNASQFEAVLLPTNKS